MLTLLGLAGYCRVWLIDYAEIGQPLSDLIHLKPMATGDQIEWTECGEESFIRLKQFMGDQMEWTEDGEESFIRLKQVMGDQIEWTKDGEESFIRLKQTLFVTVLFGVP